jgi:hypothetical protein
MMPNQGKRKKEKGKRKTTNTDILKLTADEKLI